MGLCGWAVARVCGSVHASWNTAAIASRLPLYAICDERERATVRFGRHADNVDTDVEIQQATIRECNGLGGERVLSPADWSTPTRLIRNLGMQTRRFFEPSTHDTARQQQPFHCSLPVAYPRSPDRKAAARAFQVNTRANMGDDLEVRSMKAPRIHRQSLTLDPGTIEEPCSGF
jgi:hypothetical protein